MFATLETDEYPDEAVPLLAARTLWQEYGVSIEMDFSDALLALRIHKAEVKRNNEMQRRSAKGNG